MSIADKWRASYGAMLASECTVRAALEVASATAQFAQYAAFRSELRLLKRISREGADGDRWVTSPRSGAAVSVQEDIDEIEWYFTAGIFHTAASVMYTIAAGGALATRGKQ